MQYFRGRTSYCPRDIFDSHQLGVQFKMIIYQKKFLPIKIKKNLFKKINASIGNLWCSIRFRCMTW